MKADITKWMNILKVVLAGTGVVLSMFLFGAPNNTYEISEIEKFRDGAVMSAATGYAIFTLVACAALVLVFFFVQLISNPKKTIMSIIGLVVGFVLYLVFYGIGTSDTAETLGLAESFGDVPKSTITATTAGLYTIFVGLIVATLAILGGPLLSRIKK